jgi:hypothetical protein
MRLIELMDSREWNKYRRTITGEEFHIMDSTYKPSVTNSLDRVRTILRAEGAAGVMKRIFNRFKRNGITNLYVVGASDLKDTLKVPQPIPDLEIREITETDNSDIEVVAKFGFYVHSKADVLQRFADGQRCWGAKYKNQVVACYWVQTGGFYDHYLKRRFELADDEEYHLGAFTLPEFRGKGINPYFHSQSTLARAQANPQLRVLICIRGNNKASLQSVRKQGYRIVGRLGFIEVFGIIRFQYLFGRDAFPKTTKRCFIQIIGPHEFDK